MYYFSNPFTEKTCVSANASSVRMGQLRCIPLQTQSFSAVDATT
jgi:hypothetical protein